MDPLLEGLSERGVKPSVVEQETDVDRTDDFEPEDEDKNDEERGFSDVEKVEQQPEQEHKRSNVTSQELWQSLTIEEQRERAEEALSLKEQGNVRFREKLFEAAIELYSRAIDLLDGSDDSMTLSTFFFNRSVCFFHIVSP